MVLLQGRGHEDVDRKADGLLRGVAEERLRGRVPQHDPARAGVPDDQRIANPPEQAPDAEVLG
jgi:hypothetical protein